ncbi:unnamed protein product [Cyclocybe aegerita]|uniref:Uncharacterized protein n=1 Tax=Cyclocybe aegerita TaxID=1973307 RepID=A0A8S0VYY7_CYCAE|nr:unnamed protein product [Cyclocybe aegerita]
MDVAYYFTFQNANGVPALNANEKRGPTDMTPALPLWKGANAMLFNKTDTGAPEMRVLETPTPLLQQCAHSHA